LKKFTKNSCKTAFSAIAIIPFQKQITPQSLIIRVIASLPPEITDVEREDIFFVAIAEKKEKIIIITHI
jgi:hypothetical protein